MTPEVGKSVEGYPEIEVPCGRGHIYVKRTPDDRLVMNSQQGYFYLKKAEAEELFAAYRFLFPELPKEHTDESEKD